MLVALVAIAVLCAVVLTGDRARGLFTWTNETVNDGIAGLPLPDGSGLPSDGFGILSLAGAPSITDPGAAFFQALDTDYGASLQAGDSCAIQAQASAGTNGMAEATLAVGGFPGGLALATYPAANRILAIDARRGTVVRSIRTDQAGLLWRSGIEVLDERHTVATGYHRGLFFIDRDRLEIVERHTLWTQLFRHGHIAIG